MSRKAKGSRTERELLHMFWNTGEWVVMRAPGSGAIKYPCPDLLVGNLSRKLAVECKSTKSLKIYISGEQIENLRKFSRIFGAEPWVAARFDKMEWFFLGVDDLDETEGRNYVVTIPLAKRKGFLFEEVIGKL